MQNTPSNKEYNDYVTEITPKHNLLLNCFKAFIIGGIICVIGQFINNLLIDYYNISKDNASSYTSIILVLISVILTGLNLYKPLAKFGGAGALVPITGFANSVASPTIEYQKEGEVFGKGVKIFTIAGPVILFGIVLSLLVGLVYWLFF